MDLRCTRCGETKGEELFPRDPRNTGRAGRGSHCRACQSKASAASNKKNPERVRAWKDAHKDSVRAAYDRYRERNPDKVKQWKRSYYERNRAERHGLTLEQLKAMFAEQHGLCAICRETIVYSAAHLDHCHKTGRVRGFLCMHCNRGLGALRDSPDILRAAASYLERFT